MRPTATWSRQAEAATAMRSRSWSGGARTWSTPLRTPRRAIARVPAPYREALVLFYFEEQSTKAVARALGVTEDVVHQRLSRGRRHLAAAFEGHLETSLRRRRSRRDLAAAVLAALALLPRSAH